ncbi:extracellular solute-binding protein [Paenibacillus psychroresistens]|uniref:Extracellular solute-binding protein n=1 Tax=Paenibacillus psychroresistens TaxID=1778678 RepID=A0A6B8RW04_9BACL|nr:ABC transporter substrate-binding protein [Paenibacillus psychroresistens]QGQ99396.1 extracellular solute-binding protein [Paenibacillus psychroresistens]
MKMASKFTSLLIIIGLLASFAAGCTKKDSAQPSATTAPETTKQAETAAPADTAAPAPADTPAPELKKVDLTLLVAGDQPPDQDAVLAEINKRTEKELNINLKVIYFPWADYQEKVKVMAAGGDNFDIYLDFFGNLPSAAARKQSIPLNDLIEKYGQDIKKVIPQSEFDGLSIDGKIQGIPALYPRASLGNSMAIRKDLREKYNIPEVTSLAIFEQYLDAIKKNEPSMIPFGVGSGRFGAQIGREIDDGKYIYGWGSDAYPAYVVDVTSSPYKVMNSFESDTYKKTMEWGRKAYKNGWFEKDVLTQKDDQGLFKSGKSAAAPADMFNINDLVPQLAKNVPGGIVEQVIFKKDMPLFNTGPTNNYSAISGTSKNPERAMMFLNWLLKDQANYDLYMYGIEGKHYTLKGDLIELPAGTDLANRPYNPTPWFIYNTKFHRALTTDTPQFSAALAFYKTAQVKDNPLFTFSFNADPVKTEYAQIQKVIEELAMPVLAGVLGTDADYQKLLVQVDKAGMKTVLAEAQKQIDEYLAKNNK